MLEVLSCICTEVLREHGSNVFCPPVFVSTLCCCAKWLHTCSQKWSPLYSLLLYAAGKIELYQIKLFRLFLRAAGNCLKIRYSMFIVFQICGWSESSSGINCDEWMAQMLWVFCFVLNSVCLKISTQLKVKLHSFVCERLTLDHRVFVTSATGSFNTNCFQVYLPSVSSQFKSTHG